MLSLDIARLLKENEIKEAVQKLADELEELQEAIKNA